MASYNKVMLMGRLTRDPELRYTPKGSAVTDIAIAVNRVYTAENGERREEVTYVDVTLWAKQAEVVGQYLKKGSPIFIEGRLQMDTWEDKATGQKRSKLKVVGESFQFLDSRRDGEGEDQGNGGGGGGGQRPARPAGAQQRSGSQPARQQPPANEEFNEGPITEGMEEDDIPF